jgi:hypothetical protein
MAFVPVRPGRPSRLGQSVLVVVAVALASCSSGGSTAGIGKPTTQTREHPSTTAPERSTTPVPSRTGSRGAGGLGTPLPVPTALPPFNASPSPGEGGWHAAGRLVGGFPAVYETTLVPSGISTPAGTAWMDTHLLSALLYSGSKSPGGGPYLYTAPIEPAQAASLVAAFNGGFLMDIAGGGYFTDGRVVVPLVTGAASLAIYSNGTVNVSAWGNDVSMTSDVVSVRLNLMPLVEGASRRRRRRAPTGCHGGTPAARLRVRTRSPVSNSNGGPGSASRPTARLCARPGHCSRPSSSPSSSSVPVSCAAWSSTSTRPGPSWSPTTRSTRAGLPHQATAPDCSPTPCRGRRRSSTRPGRGTSSPCSLERRPLADLRNTHDATQVR